MKLKSKKTLLLSSLAIASMLPVSLVVSNLTTTSVNNSSSNLNFNSATTQADTTAASYIFNNNQATPAEPTARQYYATNTSGDSYVIITSSTNGGTTGDQITRYNLSGTNAGKMSWVIKKDTLKTDSGTSEQSVTIKSVAYASGEATSEGYLLVLVSDSTKSYLLKYDWATGDKATINPKVDLTDKDLQNIAVVNQTSALALVFKAPKVTNANSEQTLDFYYVNDWNKSPTKQNVKISKTISNNNFSNNMYLREYKYINKNLYLLYQGDKVTANDKSHAVVKIELKNGGTIAESNLKTNNISSYTLTDSDVTSLKSGKDLFASFVDKGNNKDLAVVVKPKSDATTTAANESMLISSFTTTSVSMTTTMNSSYPVNGGYISQIKPYYGSKNTLTGFLALDTTNKVVLLNTDLTVNSLLTSFNTQTVHNIMTLKSSVDWYPQDTDGSIGDYYGANLIGELGGTQGETTENAPDYVVKTNEELDPSIKYRKISDNGTSLNADFTNYLNTADAYKDFLNIKSNDTRFGDEPVIKVTAGTLTKNTDNTYSLDLTFTQTLRKRDSNGNITTSASTNNLGTFSFTFNNQNGVIEQVTDTNKLPVNLVNKLPSEVTLDDVQNYLFNVSNVDGLAYTLNADDTTGKLSVTINVPYMWKDNNLVTNQTLEYTFDFFAKNTLANYDTSVNLVTDSYLDLDANAALKQTLSLKYGSVLPSEVTAADYLNDFVIKGAAFSNQVLISQGLITNPTADNISVTPIDKEGIAIIDVTFPKIGDKTNVKYSFTTASIFSKNPYANENFFFAFKENDQVTSYTPQGNGTTTELPYSSRKASQISTIITTTSKEQRRSMLQVFATFSNYVGNLLNMTDSEGNDMVTIKPTADDSMGLLTLEIIFSGEIDGVENTVFKQTFSGFNYTAGQVQTAPSTFSFNDNVSIATKTPSEVTEADLVAQNAFVYGGSATNLDKDITLEPINTYGQLKVTVTFYNWVEKRTINGKEYSVVIPEKTFVKVYSGFLRTGDEQDMVVWKSFDELDPTYQQSSLTASDVVNAINGANTTPLAQLKAYASVTKSIEDYLNVTGNADNLIVNTTYNDSLGTISIVANLIKDGKTQVFSSTIGGFATTNSEYSIIMVKDDSELANSLKDKPASQITENELNKLYTLTSGYEESKKHDVTYDDTKGELTLTVSLLDSNGNVLTTQQATYTGFVQNIPQYQGTDWAIFALSVAIPTVVLIIPILFIKLYMDRRDIKRFNRTLNRRLDEESKKKKSKTVKSIKDLLDR